ncbi:MAG: hypothetical protein PHS82_13145 [Lachnospiraceae bacterium]|nr:hypothetical protein [Lachnospiraceae bacterium]
MGSCCTKKREDTKYERTQAFSADGYIIDQRFTTDYPYGRFDSSYNGCGWIAAFNLIKSLGHNVTAEEINQEMASILPHHGMYGTTRKLLMEYLTTKSISFKLVQGKNKIIKETKGSRAGILRYIDDERTPHLVAFLRAGEKQFRFFNSIEGESSDFIAFEDFFEGRVFSPSTYALVVEE